MMQSLELPKISKNGNAFGPLKFNNRLDSANVKILTHLQNDNVFFRKKLAEFENRLDNISSGEPLKNTKYNHSRLRERSAKPIEVPCLGDLSRDLLNYNIPSARIHTGRSSIATAKSTESVSKIDSILDNLKKHRRSAVRRNAFEQQSSSNFNTEIIKNLRPKTTIVPKKSESPEAADGAAKLNAILERSHSTKSGRKSSKKSRARTARVPTPKKEEEEYQHMFYSRSWRIHPELGIIKDKPRDTYDNTQTHFYHTRKELPETFIFSPEWV